MYEQRHQGHHQEHHDRRAVGERSDGELDAVGLEPGGGAVDGQRRVAVADPVVVSVGVSVSVVDDDRPVDLLAVVVVPVVDPGGSGHHGQQEGDAEGCHTQLRAATGHALAEEQDAHEGQGGQQRDQPHVAQEPAASLGDPEG